MLAAHTRANEALKRSGIDVSLSGSTAVTCLKRGRRLLVANIGDSRAVLGKIDPTSGQLVAKDLSVDQKPDAPSERARIEGGGGQVHPSIVPGAGYVGPARVWDPTRRFGLACSRAMGDTVYYGPNRSGVIAEPEVTSHRLDTNDKLVILGSDGVWDRLSSQEAVDLARGCRDAEQASEKIMQVTLTMTLTLTLGCRDAEQASDHAAAARARAVAPYHPLLTLALALALALTLALGLVQVARERWRQHGPVSDDITAVVVSLS